MVNINVNFQQLEKDIENFTSVDERKLKRDLVKEQRNIFNSD